MDRVPFERLDDLLLYMRDLGFSHQALLKRAQLTPELLSRCRAQGEVSTLTYVRLCRIAANMVPDAFRSSAWAGGFASDMFRLMAYSVISAKTLGQALGRAQDFHCLLDERYPRMRLAHNDEVATLSYQPPDLTQAALGLKRSQDPEYLRAVTVISGLAVWYQFASWLVGRGIRLSAAKVDREGFPDHLSQRLQRLLYTQEIGVDDRNCLIFPARYLDFPVVQTAVTLDRFFEHSAHELVQMRPASESITEAIRKLLGEDFSGGCPSFEDIAARLDLTPSSLRRRLLKEETSYQEIKDNARQQQAFTLLRQTHLPLKTIAERAGFSEQGSFSRLFRQWTGLSPQAYRAQTNALSSSHSAG